MKEKNIDIIFKVLTILNIVAIIAFSIYFFGPFAKNTIESSESAFETTTYHDLRIQCLEGVESACVEAQNFYKNN